MLILSLLGGFFLILISLSFGLFSGWENLISDSLFIQRSPNENVVILAIDEESLDKYGAWPWPRSTIAQLTETITAHNPKVIGFDITFFEEREGDDKFINALTSTTSTVLAAKVEDQTLLTPLDQLLELENVEYGYVNFIADTDEKVRATDLVSESDNQTSSFSYQILQSYFSTEVELPPVQLGFTTVPDNHLVINYYGPQGTIPTYSLTSLDSEQGAELNLENKIILIGSTVQDLKRNLDDRFISPVGLLPGVEIHANIISQVLDGDFISSPSVLLQTAIILAVFVSSFVLATRLTLRAFSIVELAALATYVLLASLVFGLGTKLDLLYTPLSILLAWLIGIIWQYFARKRENEYLRQAFVQYLNKGLLNKLLDNPDHLKLGGERRHMTVMFSDIRDFTSISEKVEPEELVQFLNEYLTDATDTIFEHQGAVDKYLGDAIMALWNAPILDANHAKNACVAALEMIDVLEEFNRNAEDHIPELKIGVGVNTGEMLVGNLGSMRRFDYTVMGDNVNLSSRLEGLTKQYQVSIIIGSGTYQELEDEGQLNQFTTRKLDVVTVKGKSKPIEIYELMHPSHYQNLEDLVSKYEEALEKYMKGEFKSAENLFSQLTDPTSELMAKRCQELHSSKTKWPGYWQWDVK